MNGGHVIAQRNKPSPVPPKPSGPATPAPTPWQNYGSKAPISAGLYRDLTQSSLARAASSIPAVAQLEDGTIRMRVTQPMDKEGLLSSSAGVTWQASKSQVLGSPSAAVQINTPRILELDVNRMMIGQTDVRYVINGSLELLLDKRLIELIIWHIFIPSGQLSNSLILDRFHLMGIMRITSSLCRRIR